MNTTDRTATKTAFATVVAQVAQRFVDEQGMNVFDAMDAAVTVMVRKAAKEDAHVFAQTAAAFA